MADFGPLVPVAAAIGTLVAGGIGGHLSARRLRRLGLGSEQAALNAARKELKEIYEEKLRIVTGERDAALTKLAFAEASGDECRRELADLRSDVYAAKGRRAYVRRTPRSDS